MIDQRLKAVYDAAGFLFVKKGYNNTQVSQIAEAANIATGTIYNLFTGKKSILHFVLLCNLDKNYLDGQITVPVKEVDDGVIIQHITSIFEDAFSQIARKNKDGKPALSFVDMLAVMFDNGANYQIAFNIINSNPSALEEVEKRYRRFVNDLYKLIGENLMSYIDGGEVRSIEMPEFHIRNIIEGITWWSMYLPYQRHGVDLPVHKAKEIALDILTHAYLTKP